MKAKNAPNTPKVMAIRAATEGESLMGDSFWDMAQRCHWDDEWAQRMGHPAAYDYGVMRSCWMTHLVTNWMGDGAWIWKLSASVRKFNYLGDAHFVSGVVREVDRAVNTATIDVSCVNQRGETIAIGQAVVVLPR